jgi:hypothetical protein
MKKLRHFKLLRGDIDDIEDQYITFDYDNISIGIRGQHESPGMVGPVGINGGDENNGPGLSGLSGSYTTQEYVDLIMRGIRPISASDFYEHLDETRNSLPKNLRSLIEVGVNLCENKDYEPLNHNHIVDKLKSVILHTYLFGLSICGGVVLLKVILSSFVW